LYYQGFTFYFIGLGQLIDVSPVLGSSATGAGVKYLPSLRSYSGVLTLGVQNAFVYPSVCHVLHRLWIRCLKDGKKPPSDLARECVDNNRYRPPHHARLHLDHVCFFLLRGCFTTLNGSKYRTRGLSSGCSDRRRPFIPEPDSGTSSSNASEGHGYCDERLHVPSVSEHFRLFSLTETTEVPSMLGGAVGLAIGEAIIASLLPRKLATIPNIASLGLGDDITALNDSIGMIHLIPVCRRYLFVPCR
jgi:hypothetical protein